MQGRAEPPGLGWDLGALAGTRTGYRDAAPSGHNCRQQRAIQPCVLPCPRDSEREEGLERLTLKLEPQKVHFIFKENFNSKNSVKAEDLISTGYLFGTSRSVRTGTQGALFSFSFSPVF